MTLEYGKSLPRQRRRSGCFPVVGSGGVIGLHDKAAIKGPGIVIGRKGSIGSVTWIGKDFVPIDTTYYVVPVEGLGDLKWMYYVLTSENLAKLNNATGVPGLNRNDVYALRRTIPPLAEQRAIAAVLDSIDEAIERTDAVIAAAEQLRDGLRHELLTRGLPGWHTEWKEVPRFGAIPADWKIVRLAEVAEVVMGQSPPGKTVFDWEGRTFPEGGLPFVQGNAQFGSKFPQPLKWCVKPAKVAKSDAILISVRAPVGQTNRVEQRLAIGRGLAAIRFTGVDRSYGWHAINQAKHALQPISQGSTFRAIGSKDLRSLTLTYPPLPEQQAIARTLDSVDNVVEASGRRRDALNQIKVSTAEALLTGQRRVPLRVGDRR